MSNQAVKQEVMQRLQQENAMMNAKALIDKINNTCFERCVPNPQTTLSSKDQQCHTMCMEKYMSAWNTVSRTYVQRLQQEQSQRQMLGGIGSADL